MRVELFPTSGFRSPEWRRPYFVWSTQMDFGIDETLAFVLIRFMH